jgi:hypothetical protein
MASIGTARVAPLPGLPCVSLPLPSADVGQAHPAKGKSMSTDPVPVASVAPPVWHKRLSPAVLIGGIVAACLASCMMGVVGTVAVTSLSRAVSPSGSNKQANTEGGKLEIVGKWEPANKSPDGFLRFVEFKANGTGDVATKGINQKQNHHPFRWEIDGQSNPVLTVNVTIKMQETVNVAIKMQENTEVKECFYCKTQERSLILTPLAAGSELQVFFPSVLRRAN